jgi:hypothetical protein
VRRIVLLLAVALALPASQARCAGVGVPETTSGGIAGLEERLTLGLRVRIPRDKAFCENVVRLVRQGRLPVKLVDSAYLWAVQRGRKYPFPAFEYVIRLQADRLGVDLESPQKP